MVAVIGNCFWRWSCRPYTWGQKACIASAKESRGPAAKMGVHSMSGVEQHLFNTLVSSLNGSNGEERCIGHFVVRPQNCIL